MRPAASLGTLVSYRREISPVDHAVFGRQGAVIGERPGRGKVWRYLVAVLIDLLVVNIAVLRSVAISYKRDNLRGVVFRA